MADCRLAASVARTFSRFLCGTTAPRRTAGQKEKAAARRHSSLKTKKNKNKKNKNKKKEEEEGDQEGQDDQEAEEAEEVFE